MADPFEGFGDLFDNTFGGGKPLFSQDKAPKKPEKGIPWQAKQFDGQYYVPLSQVADLLKANDVLPAVRKGIERRVQALKDQQ